MASLTPKSRSNEVTSEAMNEGLIYGSLTFVPSLAGLYYAMQNPKFRKFTNWQSRTAMAIMPPLFIFAFTSEKKLEHRMKQVADDTEYTLNSVEWAERQARRQAFQSDEEERNRLRGLYRQSVMQSGVRVVPELHWYHEGANYVQQNPIKVLLGVGIPAVGYVFYGRTGKEHLSLQMKILHTRVLGQATVLVTLLSIMGLKGFMDRQGQFLTELDVESRVDEMENTRLNMLERLEYQTTVAARPMAHSPKKKDTDKN